MSKTSTLSQINTITNQEDIWIWYVVNCIFLVQFYKYNRIALEKSKISLETTKWNFLNAEIIQTMVI